MTIACVPAMIWQLSAVAVSLPGVNPQGLELRPTIAPDPTSGL